MNKKKKIAVIFGGKSGEKETFSLVPFESSRQLVSVEERVDRTGFGASLSEEFAENIV